MTQWYYSKSGQQFGPVSEEELRLKMQSGELLPSDLVWREGMADWFPLERVAELQASASMSPPPASLSGMPIDPQSSMGSVQLPQPPAYHGDFIEKKIPNYVTHSVVALVISVIQTFMFCLPISLVFAIIALVYANKVDSLRVQQRYMEATSASNTAKIMMIVSFGISGLVVIGFVVMMVIVFTNA